MTKKKFSHKAVSQVRYKMCVIRVVGLSLFPFQAMFEYCIYLYPVHMTTYLVII